MIEIIPAIDIVGGRCVRLTQGDYALETEYFKDPAEAARRFADAGLGRLHLVDLDGARASKPRNLHVLSRIASCTTLEIQYGGGIKSTDSLRRVLEAGASRAICGSVAVTQPELLEEWLAEFGGERITLGADVRGGVAATHGWSEASTLTADDLVGRFAAAGLRRAIVTDISRDGMLTRPAFELYTALQARFPEVEITASGGVSTFEDIRRLDGLGVRSVIVGKALYENRITLPQLNSMIRL